MIRLELQSSGHFSVLNVSAVSLLFTLDISFTDLHTSQERFSTRSSPQPQTQVFDLPFSSILGSVSGNTTRTKQFLRLLSFLTSIIVRFIKTALWATSGVSNKQKL